MDWQDRCSLARARVLVLQELTDLGVKPTAAQLRKALHPVLCDLAPAAVDRRSGRGRRRRPDGRFVAAPSAAGSRALMPEPPGRPARAGAVDKKTD
jgi:hypothetical protein